MEKACSYIEVMQHRRETVKALVAAIKACHPEDASKLLTVALEGFAAGGPPPLLLDLRSEAEFWAELANPIEHEAYFAACASRMLAKPQHKAARKRTFWALWKTFTKDEQQAFRGKISDPCTSV